MTCEEPFSIDSTVAKSEWENLISKMGNLKLSLNSDQDNSDFEDDSVALTIPDHACTCCSVHDPLFVVKCVKCSKWFCNNQKEPLSGHLFQHLMKSGHNLVSLHPELPIVDDPFGCYNCGCKNIFLLGFVQTIEGPVVLCRQPCALKAMKKSYWNLESWSQLMINRHLLTWLAPYPSKAKEALAKTVSIEQNQKLKEDSLFNSLSQNNNSNRSNLKSSKVALESTKLSYSDPVDYSNIMIPLISAEAKVDQDIKEAQKLYNVTIRWDIGSRNKTIIWFPRPSLFKIKARDGILLRHPNPSCGITNWYAIGEVIDTAHYSNSEICVEIRPGYNCVNLKKTGYAIEFMWNSVGFDRMRESINILVMDKKSVSRPILNLLMGKHVQSDQLNLLSQNHSDLDSHDLEDDFSAPNLPVLNSSQVHAARCALQRPLTLIQGPPGTGKTSTSASIVYQLSKKGPVLVVATSNVAVDHLAEMIHKTGLNVVRVLSRAREARNSSIAHLSLHVKARTASGNPEYDRLHKLRSVMGHLSVYDESRLFQLQKKAEQIVLDAAQVVCCTCVGAGDPRIVKRPFKSLLIDEAAQATEPIALIPLAHGIEQAILVGDHRQLGPVIRNMACSKAGYDRSLFERLIEVGVQPLRLQVQYRMHPCLSDFPSNMFYDGSLQNGVTSSERTRLNLDFPWPNSSVPMLFLSSFGSEELGQSSTSYLNRSEAENVKNIVNKLLKASILPSQIGVITPYQAQQGYLAETLSIAGSLKKELNDSIEVASVDAFQGREKDYIILSCVRSNRGNTLGFVSDVRRMNVSLTRARYGLIIVGNPTVLSTSPHWKELILRFKNLQVLMEGSIDNLRPLHVSS